MTVSLQDLQSALELCRTGRREEAALAYRRPGAASDAAVPAEELDLLGRLAGGLGHDAEALTWLERAAAAVPTAERLIAVGQARLAARDFQESAAAFRRAGAIDGAPARAWLGLGDAERELGRWREAAAAYERASGQDPQLQDAWVGLSLALVNLGRVEDGLAACRTALALDGTAPAAHRALALAFLRAGRPEDAERAALAARELAPDAAECGAVLALVRMMQGRLEDAEALFAGSIRAKPTLAEAIGNRAAVLARLGRDGEALQEVARAIKLKPFLPPPYLLLGRLMRRAGRFLEAAAAFEQAMRLAPDHLEARADLADTLRLAGQAKTAAMVCLAGLERHPNHVGLLSNLGTALQEDGDIEGALVAYGRALELAPGLPEVENNIARLHQAAGRSDEALGHLRRAAAARPDDQEIVRNLIGVLCETGGLDEAGEAARLAVRVPGQEAAAFGNLARLRDRHGRRADAEAAARLAIVLAPDGPEGWFQAAALWLRAGERLRALPYARRVVRLAPDNGRAWGVFGEAVRGVRFAAADGALRADLEEALAQPGTEKAHLTDAVLSVVGLNPAMVRLSAAAALPDPDAAVAALLGTAGMGALAGDVLLRTLLETTVVASPGVERVLTVLRRTLLGLRGAGGITVLDHFGWLPLLCALADQCFLNEYAFVETPGETAAVERLAAGLSDLVGRREVPLAADVALLAAYRPLFRWQGAADLVAFPHWPAAMVGLLRRHVREPVTEETLIPRIERLTPIEDAVSRAVRAQYEENPYPRWRHAGLLDAPVPMPRFLRAILPHVTLDPEPWAAPEVLVAGCGTGRESVWTANQLAGARVLAVDLSLTSLGYARRQTAALGFGGVNYAQADILGLKDLRRRFDLIQCVGVLHHLADPLAGWRILRGLLKPHGVMKIGLYSERARRAVVAARGFIAERGYGTAPEDIRRLRSDVLALPADHPMAPIARTPDFYNLSACRDLLFHVQEHRTTLPEIAGWLDELGLEFLGFQHEDPTVAVLYRDRFPEDPDMTSLPLWDRFEAENPDTFAGLYQFWVRIRPDPRGEAKP